VEPDYQGAKAESLMLGRARGLLRRLRPVPPPVERIVPPPRRWPDELAEAGVNANDWVASRSARGRLYVDLDDAVIERLRLRHPDLVDSTIDAASQVLRHQFDLLGSAPYIPDDPDRAAGPDGYRPIDWYLDPVSGLRFPRAVALAEWDLERMRPRALISLPSPACGEAGRGALACRRSTAALAAANQRRRSAPARASWDAACFRRYLKRACPSPASFSQTGHGAGRAFSRSPPGTAVTSRRPREPHSLPAAGVTQAAVLYSSEIHGIRIRNGDECQ
jgi:hypothetical protein